MQQLELVLLDTNIPDTCVEKFKTSILSAILVSCVNINGEQFWKVNSDYKHVLKGKNSCILDFVRSCLNWNDVYDVDLFGLQIKKQYEEVKSHINDFINISSAYVECHAVVKTTPNESFMIMIVGKKAMDVLHIGETARLDLAAKFDILNNTINNRITDVTNLVNTQIQNVNNVVNSQIFTIKEELKNNLTTITETTDRKICEFNAKCEKITLDSNNKFEELARKTEFVDVKFMEINNATNQKIDEAIRQTQTVEARTTEMNNATNQKIDEAIRQTQTIDAKTIEMNNVTNQKFDEAIRQTQTICANRCQEILVYTDTKLDAVKNELIAMMNQLKNDISERFVTLNASVNDRMAKLDNSIQDLETVAFPKGKDFLRI